MPVVERRGKRWRARAHIKGKPVSAGTWPTKVEALQAALDVERKAKAGNLAGAHGKLVRDVLERYADEVSPTKRGAKWETNRLMALCRVDWAKLPADRLTPDILGKYRDARLRTVTGATIIREFNLLSAVFETAKREWRWMNSNPLHEVRRPKDSSPRTRRLRDGELEALRIASGYRPDQAPGTATARVIAAAEFAIETAMRSGEICALTWAHVHAHYVHLPKTKNDDPRDVPLSQRALQILAQMKAHGRGETVFGLTDGSRSALWRKIVKRAGIEGLTFHDLRATAITRLSTALDPLALARMVGHKNVSQLMTYYREGPDVIAARLELAFSPQDKSAKRPPQ